jgi:hypothetical protein
VKAGDVIAETIEKQLVHTRERRTGVEARGQMVITTSGTLVTLQLAFVAVVAPDKVTVSPLPCPPGSVARRLSHSRRPGSPNQPPRASSEMSPESLHLLVGDPHWDADEEKARRRVASARISVLEDSIRLVRKVRRLPAVAIASEVAAMAMLAVTVLLITLEQ